MPFKVVKKKPTPPKVVRASKKTLTKKAPKKKKLPATKGPALSKRLGKKLDSMTRNTPAYRKARRKKK